MIKKAMAAMLTALMLFMCGCNGATQVEPDSVISFSCAESELFPFFCIDVNGNLWKISSNGATPLNICVSFSAGSLENSFLRYIKSNDLLIFAQSITVNNGVTLCSICTYRDSVNQIKENVIFNSLRVNKFGEMLFITSDGSLYYFKGDTLSFIEANVADAEFVGEDAFLARSSEGTYRDGSFHYPIYSYISGYRNYIDEGLEIVKADRNDGYGIIIKSKRTVQKRAAAREVGDLIICGDGEVISEIRSAVIGEVQGGDFILACDEYSTTLKYNLYQLVGGVPSLISDNVISGKYISTDMLAYMYETESNGKIMTNTVLTNGKKTSFEADSDISCIKYIEPNTYVLAEGRLSIMNGKTLLENIESVYVSSNTLIAVKGNEAPYSIYTCVGEALSVVAADALSTHFEFCDDYLYYYSGERDSYNLAMTDCKTSFTTALISNVDSKIGYIYNKSSVAAVKNDDKMLFIISGNSYIGTTIAVSRFVCGNEII